MATAAIARAPGSIGNIAVGFDVLGHAFSAVRDEVRIYREPEAGVRLGDVSGLAETLPEDEENNAALAAAAAVLGAGGAKFGARVDIDKGVPLNAGLGGSGASAVAGAAAANLLLDEPFDAPTLLEYAILGERAASGSPAWDNVMPSLFGGLMMAARIEPALVRPIPAPSGLTAVVVLPEAEIETRHARAVLPENVALDRAVEHARRTAAFTAGCCLDDPELIAAGLEDVLVEPERARLLPGFTAVKTAALNAGALGCSFSGSGPALFAWVRDADAGAVERVMREALASEGLNSRAWRAPIDSPGVEAGPL